MRVVAVRPVIACGVHDPISPPDDQPMTGPIEALDCRLRLGRQVRHRADLNLSVELSGKTAHGGPGRVTDASES